MAFSAPFLFSSFSFTHFFIFFAFLCPLPFIFLAIVCWFWPDLYGFWLDLDSHLKYTGGLFNCLCFLFIYVWWASGIRQSLRCLCYSSGSGLGGFSDVVSMLLLWFSHGGGCFIGHVMWLTDWCLGWWFVFIWASSVPPQFSVRWLFRCFDYCSFGTWLLSFGLLIGVLLHPWIWSCSRLGF